MTREIKQSQTTPAAETASAIDTRSEHAHVADAQSTAASASTTSASTTSASDTTVKSRRRWRRLFMNRRLWAVLIVILGLWLMFFFGTRTLRAYREFEYAREQGLLNGTASVEAIQPWMTIRYIAVAYAVPEEYIYAKLEIPFDRRLAHAPLGRLARQRPPDEAAGAEERSQVPAPPDSPKEFDAFLARVRSVILAYRENPVAPGLRDIRPWMSLAYIANSTGVPIEYLLQEVAAAAQTALATERAAREPADQESASETELGAEVDTDENRHKPLDLLSGDLHYPGGPEQLLDVVRMALTNYEEAPAQE